MSGLLITRAEVAGRAPLDVRIRAGRIRELDSRLAPRPDEARLDAQGGALLPGLNDHHVHLLAAAAAQDSLHCGPPAVRSAEDLARLLRQANAAVLRGPRCGWLRGPRCGWLRGPRCGWLRGPRCGWLRGVGYHEVVAGELDRWRLDTWVPDRPLRIQHRSGALWMLNSAAVERLGLERTPLPDGVERDDRGRITGRFFRLDDWLRGPRGGGPDEETFPSLERVGQQLAGFGVTGVSDATARNAGPDLERLIAAVESGELPQRLLVMGRPELPPSPHPRVTRGHVKLMLEEEALPGIDDLAAAIRRAHADDRGVALHCVTRAEGVVAASGLAAAGCRAGDRIEHASVTPPDVMELLAALPVAIVTQPNFIFERGDSYRAEVEPRDQPWLYRCRGFLDAGLPLAAGTDAPFGDADPWAAMRAAVERRSESGATMGPDERLDPEQALALFTSPLDSPGARPPVLRPGCAADLCLLDRPWSRAREALDARHVRASFRDGEIIWQRA